jgi:hypothetical protein
MYSGGIPDTGFHIKINFFTHATTCRALSYYSYRLLTGNYSYGDTLLYILLSFYKENYALLRYYAPMIFIVHLVRK